MTSNEGLSFEGRSKGILFLGVWAGSACEQYDQCEYCRENYQLNAHNRPPMFPIRIMARMIIAVIHCSLFMAVSLWQLTVSLGRYP